MTNDSGRKAAQDQSECHSLNPMFVGSLESRENRLGFPPQSPDLTRPSVLSTGSRPNSVIEEQAVAVSPSTTNEIGVITVSAKQQNSPDDSLIPLKKFDRKKRGEAASRSDLTRSAARLRG